MPRKAPLCRFRGIDSVVTEGRGGAKGSKGPRDGDGVAHKSKGRGCVVKEGGVSFSERSKMRAEDGKESMK